MKLYQPIWIESLVTVVVDLQYTQKRIQGEDQDEAFCDLVKLVELTFRQICSGENFVNPVSCIFLYSEKH